MSIDDGYTDIRLVPITAEHHAALLSEDASRILSAVRGLVAGYDKAPPLTHAQAVAYASDVEWWRDQISDL